MSENPSQTVEELARAGWVAWFGPATQHWWALPPRWARVQRLAEGATPDELAAAILRAEIPPARGGDTRPLPAIKVTAPQHPSGHVRAGRPIARQAADQTGRPR
jgi:hypothetical protein